MHHRDFDIANGLRAALIHFGKLLDALFAQPSGQLRNSDRNRVVLLTDFDRVAVMVAVTCVQRRTSTFFTCFSDSGHMGLPMTQGSIMIVLPPGVSMRNVAWPNQVSLTPCRFMIGLPSYLLVSLVAAPIEKSPPVWITPANTPT